MPKKKEPDPPPSKKKTKVSKPSTKFEDRDGLWWAHFFEYVRKK